jgi:hypothetical protein
MAISRRGFLGCAAGASVAGIAVAAGMGTLLAETPATRSSCVLVDPGADCPLPESAAGYEDALLSSNVMFQRTTLQSLTPARAIILPAAVETDEKSQAIHRKHLENGSVILYESAAAFLGPEEFGFHKRVIRSVFGLSLHDPVRLWDSADSHKQSPYVDYHWPVVTKVRDFSRIVPVDPGDGETIAWFGDLPIAARRRIGKGTLVFLGSPLGPHLLSDDKEAIRWLQAFCSAS